MVYHRELHLEHADTLFMWRILKYIPDIDILSPQPEAGIHQVFQRPERPTWEWFDWDFSLQMLMVYDNNYQYELCLPRAVKTSQTWQQSLMQWKIGPKGIDALHKYNKLK